MSTPELRNMLLSKWTQIIYLWCEWGQVDSLCHTLYPQYALRTIQHPFNQRWCVLCVYMYISLSAAPERRNLLLVLPVSGSHTACSLVWKMWGKRDRDGEREWERGWNLSERVSDEKALFAQRNLQGQPERFCEVLTVMFCGALWYKAGNLQ